MALIAGYVDAYSLQTTATFVSFMSGNTTGMGSFLGQRSMAAAIYPALAILFFVTGTFCGTWLLHSSGKRRRLYVMVSILLGVSIAVKMTGAWSTGPIISLLSLSMGMMNTALSSVGGEPVSLTFVTGSLNKIGSHLALAFRGAPLQNAQGTWDTHLRRAALMAAIWAGFLTGAIIAGALTPHLGVKTLLAPWAALIGLSLFSRAD